MSHNPLLTGETAQDYSRALARDGERRRLAAFPITLDGDPAQLCGLRHRFAVVRSCVDPCRSAEWAWPTVAHIIDDRGGAFRT